MMPTIDAAYALGRWAHFCALMLAFGWLGFLAWASPARLRPSFDRAPARIALGAAGAIALLSAVLLPALHGARIMGDFAGGFDPQTLRAVLLRTAWGQAWLLHAAATAALFLTLSLGIARVHTRPLLPALIAAGALGTLALAGHAASASGPQAWFWGLNEALHLLGAGLWLGSLLAVPACLRWLGDPGRRALSVSALMAFSWFGHGAVALVLLSGALNAGLVLAPRLPLHGNPYLFLLAAKTALVLGMAGIALYNRYVVVPKFGADPERLRATMARTTVAEIALGLLALALVSVFASMDPGG